MKIALVHLRHAYSGGVELYLNQMARYLAERGEDVTIICRSHDKEPPHPNVKFVRLKGISFGKTHRLWKFAKAVENHVKHSNYDLVYGLAHAWSHDVLRIGAGTSYHMSRSLDKPMRLKDRVNHLIESKAMASGAYQHVICNSNKSALEIQEAHGVPKDKITVIHNFVDTARFDAERVATQSEQIKQLHSLNDNKPIFLFLGTGYERKGLKQALTALSKLDFDAQLLIVGRETHESEYVQFAKQLKVYEQCLFLGSESRPELYFSLADCYLLPTLYEPFGFTVIEALSCGTPAITTENCGAKEVLNPNVSTVIGADVNPDELARAMAYWANKKKTTDVSKRCRSLALTMDMENVLEKNYQQLLQVYQMKRNTQRR
ncbi:glycosyltransferase family 4 protein [Vibrio sp. SCSIO 43135]|uniref:Glycosyltransferase family 4 protein n=1 Tax=Vibrio paucivorans TaxID=2829489 RepID=A0A9X3HR03_9VIBR|nr:MULTISPECIES: glycosyltransferase family 4 protein [Vibrio]MCW8333613.1 glycosyltransferase family 4 protein [Vibrio paucivorans]USD41278.1 glycosyltransferase family 4 protein [Vibrio sp. SCSIO 43135]